MKTIAVMFGGESVEHDVSILTALQFMNAMDPGRYTPLPLYVAADGAWWTGEALRDKKFYPLNEAGKKNLSALTLPTTSFRHKKPYFLARSRSAFKSPKQIPFDLIVPAIHGSHGEDGTLQGLLDFIGIPYAGSGTLGAAAAMDKAFSKDHLKGRGLPVLDHLVVKKPAEGTPLSLPALKQEIAGAFGKNPYPLIVKPCHLGSSIGVTAAASAEDVMAGLLLCFRMDHAAILEPFVENLVEYNIAVSKAFGTLKTSVIEQPLKENQFLGFGDKYLSGDKDGPKTEGPPSEGMASLNRVMDPPELSKAKKSRIREWAAKAFEALDLAGSVRIDFLGNEKTGELWFNEINTVPGSFAYYLWQESKPQVSFTDLTSAIIEEGFRQAARADRETGQAHGGSIIFKNK